MSQSHLNGPDFFLSSQYSDSPVMITSHISMPNCIHFKSRRVVSLLYLLIFYDCQSIPHSLVSCPYGDTIASHCPSSYTTMLSPTGLPVPQGKPLFSWAGESEAVSVMQDRPTGLATSVNHLTHKLAVRNRSPESRCSAISGDLILSNRRWCFPMVFWNLVVVWGIVRYLRVLLTW